MAKRDETSLRLVRLERMAYTLEQMAIDKLNMKLSSAASVLLGMLKPATVIDIERGKEVASRLRCD